MYFLLLAALGGRTSWDGLLVPPGPVPFYDLASVTTAWDCVDRGERMRDVMVSNKCDPDSRPANYPRVWLLPGLVGLGSELTTPLGIAVAVVFLTAALWLARASTPREGLVWAAALVSPAVMLGIERGNADLVVFAILVVALALLRRGTKPCAIAHGLLCSAAILKLFPAFGFAVLLRQPGRWRVRGTASVVAIFAVYVIASLGDIRVIRSSVPEYFRYSFGAGVVPEALDLRRPGLAELAIVSLATLAAVLVAWGRRARWETATEARHGTEAQDAFVVGAAIYVGSYALFQSWDYRLVILLLTIPQLLRWSRISIDAAVPAPRAVLGLVLAALWTGAAFSRANTELPWDELVNLILFVVLLAGLLQLLAPALGVTPGQGAAKPADRRPHSSVDAPPTGRASASHIQR